MVAMASFSNDNTAYQEWLRTQCDVVDADLDHKHERMKKNAFVFMRATYFRWRNVSRKSVPTWRTLDRYYRSVTSTLRTSARGATSKGVWCGALTTSTKLLPCLIR